MRMQRVPGILTAVFFLASACAGVGSPGLLGAANFNVSANYETTWKALMDLLRDDPTLFEANSTRPPNPREDGLITGSKSGRDVAVWVQPQGKDNTTVAVQVLLGFIPDDTAQWNLTQAIRTQMVKKLR